MRHCLLVGLVVLAACSGSGDDDGVTIDAGMIDANNLPLCTGALYDTCFDNSEHTDCASGLCRFYMHFGGSACTQACSASVTCPPDPTGAAVSCNMMGQCRPENRLACQAPPP